MQRVNDDKLVGLSEIARVEHKAGFIQLDMKFRTVRIGKDQIIGQLDSVEGIIQGPVDGLVIEFNGGQVFLAKDGVDIYFMWFLVRTTRH